jgi:uncharacterized circularly permuted ATP-grasp superfamily protein/uncharacterized alpha-E superfamily protein
VTPPTDISQADPSQADPSQADPSQADPSQAAPSQGTLPPPAAILPGGYRAPGGSWDEMWDDTGRVRPHWQSFIDAVGALGGEELERRRQEAERFLQENGVTFNLHPDDTQEDRPWEYDPLPFLIDEADWSNIEAGLVQRARLLDRILADLMGPRSLLERGLLPPDLIYGHPGFLYAADRVALPGPRQLILYAADIARGPDGRMWVLADRTQAPFGMGYALENRTATTRLFPAIFRDCNVRRLAAFFRTLHERLTRLHRGGGAAPRIVVLTPGPSHPTYFEHAYLAAYLGYALVQGSDLTVRNGAVWLKSLEGLERVDVILRRVDDALCDPLELRGDTAFGVPGLLEAARQGQVAIANPLGSGVLENPGLLAFLPSVARQLLGEELLLPSAATWWCGQPAERDYVDDHLHDLILKPIYRDAEAGSSVFANTLDEAGLEGLRNRLHAAPHTFVGQERVQFSTAPSFVGRHLEPRQAILRVFVVAGDDGYIAMPGGLTRSAADRGATFVSTAAGGVTKDTWVLSSQPEAHVSLWQQRPDAEDVQPTPALPSRAAENLFWVGRYAERAEATTRLLRTIITALTQDREFSRQDYSVYLEQLLASLTRLTDTGPGFTGEDAADKLADPRPELLSVAADAARPGSLAFTLQSLVRAAFAVRDRWSTDSWRVVDDLHEYVWRLGHPGRDNLRYVNEQLDQLITPLSAFAGLNQESMTREAGWVLLDMGRRIERALQLTRLVRSCLVRRHGDEVDHLLLEAVLMSKESLITYRRRYRSYPQLARALELLLLDRQNPRGLAFQLEQLRQHLTHLPGESSVTGVGPVERPILDAHTQVRLAVADDLAHAGRRTGNHRGLERLIASVETLLAEAAQVLDERYFRHVADSHQLVPIGPSFGP